MKTIKSGLVALVAILTIATSAVIAAPKGSVINQNVLKVRHELVTLPYYGVFDNLGYRV